MTSALSPGYPHARTRNRISSIFLVAAAMLLAICLAPIARASATPATGQNPASRHSTQLPRRPESEAEQFQQKADEVIAEARKQRGKPYVYGSDGPHSFDCSGLVRYVFLHALHVSLPHNAAEQYDESTHIRRSHLRIGDLVFVDNGGYVSHVGIYDGHGFWWVAPHTGTHVQRQKIYSAHFVYGRVIKWPRNH